MGKRVDARATPAFRFDFSERQYILHCMKTTLDIPDDLYHAVKAKSALEGTSVRRVTMMLYGDWLSRPRAESPVPSAEAQGKKRGTPLPAWFARGRANVRRNAGAAGDLEVLRQAVARGIALDRAGVPQG